MTAFAWTDDRIDRLKTLWLEGKTADQIARDLAHGITRSAVLGKVYRMGLSAGRTSCRKSARAKAPAGSPPRPLRPKRESCPASPTDSAPETGLTTLRSIGKSECRWPCGEPCTPGFSLCGRPIARGSFCAAHAARAYRPSRDAPRTLDRLATLN